MSCVVRRRAIVLFRITDLRLLDNEVLSTAHKVHSEVAHVFCFDPRLWSKEATVDYSRSVAVKSGLAKLSLLRRQYLVEAIEDLRTRLRTTHASDLILRIGRPEDVVPRLIAEGEVASVLFHRAEADEEMRVEAALTAALPATCAATSIWGNTLINVADLPGQVVSGAGSFPRTFSQFRTAVEKGSKSGVPLAVRSPLPIPSPFRPAWRPAASAEDAKTTSEVAARAFALGIDGTTLVPGTAAAPPLPPSTSAAAGPWKALASATFVGGETAALAHVASWMWEKDLLKTYKKTRNGLLGVDYSSKFSPWLATGSLTAATIFAEVKRYESARVANNDTYWLVFELLWRDFLRHYTVEHGSSLFHRWGPRGTPREWHLATWKDQESAKEANAMEVRWRAWTRGMTGVPLVDAFMRELSSTGFMGNRGRQIVASFLVRDLGVGTCFSMSLSQSPYLRLKTPLSLSPLPPTCRLAIGRDVVRAHADRSRYMQQLRKLGLHRWSWLRPTRRPLFQRPKARPNPRPSRSLHRVVAR